jgi:osmotically-inducible protein OsmY
MKRFIYILITIVVIYVIYAAFIYFKERKTEPDNFKQDISIVALDSAITASIKAKFITDTTLNGLQIHVKTEKGIVTLSGTVTSEDLKEHAILLAESTDGVKEVISKLEVKHKPHH